MDKHYDEVVEWCRKAAKGGNVDAQFWLGYMYRYGDGIPKDYPEAAKWFYKAAKQRNTAVQKAFVELKTHLDKK